MLIDTAKAETIFNRLLDAYYKKEYPYDQPEAIPPQVPANLPKDLVWGSREHALFLFKLCYWMRGGIKSHTATKALAKLYGLYPEAFYPEFVLGLDVGPLAVRFIEVGLGFNAVNIAKAWIENLAKFALYWESDPRNLFTGITTYEEACARIQRKGKRRGFLGFQEKMVSMITYFYMDAGIVDRWHFPIPVELHVLRTIFAHEIIVADASEFNGNGFYTKPILAAARNIFQSYCVKHNVDPIALCEAVWLYSGIMCNQHAGNQSEVEIRNGRKTIVQPMSRWSVAQTATYDRTCGVCAIQETCRWCVPSAEYYIKGRIILREPRDQPPQSSLFPMFTSS